MNIYLSLFKGESKITEIIAKINMKKQNLFILIAVLLFIQTSFAQRDSYPNLLDTQNVITDVKDVKRSFFSDLGAWHAYSLPKSKKDFGGFIGPLVMDLNGRWLSNSLAKLEIREDGKLLDLANAEVSANYYPGLLKQTSSISQIEIVQKLIFVSNREALIESKIKNLSAKTRNLEISFSGELLLEKTSFEHKANKLTVNFDDEKRFVIDFNSRKRLDIKIDERFYKATYSRIKLKSNKAISLHQSQKYYLEKKGVPAKLKKLNFAKELKKNKKRWNNYIKSYFSKAPKLNNEKKRLAVKAIMTLQTNWRSAAKDLLHDGTFPSSSYQGFYGFWSWDSWKHAVALAYFNPKLAKSNILSMFDYQDEFGMVADCIYTDKKENNWRDTKPPLSAWAVWNVYKQTGDKRFAKQMFGKLIKYHNWWYRNRDNNKNGLCEYGSTDGTRVAAGWESGMDNAVRFDNAKMIKTNDKAWSFDQESVDLNAYLYAEKLYLAKLAKLLGKKNVANNFKEDAKSLKQKINEKFFSKKKGFYYDFQTTSNKLITIEGTEGWIPLWAEVASTQEAINVSKIMTDEKKFNTKIPLPTFTADHPKFDPLKGYWRGPVWLDQFYFGIDGLKKYGFEKEAEMLTNKLWQNADGLLTDKEIRENYHPITGKGLNAKNFSWSAAHILLLLNEN